MNANSSSIASRFRRFAVTAAWWLLAVGAPAATDPKTEPPAPGTLIRLLRDEPLRFYEKPHRPAKAGDTFEVLEYRAASNRVFFEVQEGTKRIAVWVPADAVEPLKKKTGSAADREQSNALFAGRVPALKIRLSEDAMEKLRKEPKTYVEAELREADGKVWPRVGLKLKGSVGSFRAVDDRPGFSIHTGKFKGGERFYGLQRFQLNNGAQDDTLLRELISGEIARSAGVPASRCGHALVTLNDKPLGIYVLKEGFTEDFLGTFFKRTDGRLYDGGFCAELRKDMELDRGEPRNQERLAELLQTLEDPDADRQFQRLRAAVDGDAYLRYLALENILCHWDGYSFNRNNYRVYENPQTGRFHFVLHGMDQTFGDPARALRIAPQAAVGAILWRNPAIRTRYEEILQDIHEKVLRPGKWPKRTEEVGNRLLAAVKAAAPDQARDYAPKIAVATEQVRARMQEIDRQMRLGDPLKHLNTTAGVDLSETPWTAHFENAQGEERTDRDRVCLYIQAAGEANGSWRLPLFLPPGTYRFDARIRTQGVVKLSPPSGEGAGIRVSGGTRLGRNALEGDTPWKPLSYEFTTEGGETTLVAELRAQAGEMWVERKTLRLMKVR